MWHRAFHYLINMRLALFQNYASVSCGRAVNKQLLGNWVLGRGVPVTTGMQYGSRRSMQSLLSSSHSKPFSVGITNTQVGVGSSAELPEVGPGAQEPEGQVHVSPKVAVTLTLYESDPGGLFVINEAQITRCT